MLKKIEIPYDTNDSKENDVLFTLKSFFESLVNSDLSKFDNVWNKEAKIFNLGNSNVLQIDDRELIIEHRLNGLKKAKEQIPGFEVNFNILKIDKVTVHDVIAVIDVFWQMLLPDSKGNHFSSFHLAKNGPKWEIVSFLDRGIEIAN